MPRAIVVEDEADVALLIQHHLRKHGFEVVVADRGWSALAAAAAQPPDVVVLDLALPDLDGIEVCRRLRADAATRRVGIVMVTARGLAADRVVGLEAGADDYVVKPVSMRELLLRTQAVVRRTRPADPPAQLTVGPIALDRAAYAVTIDGAAVELRRLEFLLLECLMVNAERTVSRKELLTAVWQHKGPANARMVDVTVSRLRLHLGPWAALIETVPYGGYRIRKLPPQ